MRKEKQKGKEWLDKACRKQIKKKTDLRLKYLQTGNEGKKT